MGHVILGGTFNILHDGHVSLLRTAGGFGKISVGLCTDEFARRWRRAHSVLPCAQRRKRLEREIKRLGMGGKCEIFPLASMAGPGASRNDITAIIASSATYRNALAINARRKRNGLRPLRIIEVPMLLAQDLKPISSHRIADRTIDIHGRRLVGLNVVAGTANPSKLLGIRRALKRAFPSIAVRLRPVKVSSRIPSQPIGYNQTWLGAKNRAMAALRKGKRADYSIGLESGLLKFGPRLFDVLLCAIYDGQSFYAGMSMGFGIPNNVKSIMFANNCAAKSGGAKFARARRTLGHAAAVLSGEKNIAKKGGAISHLSGKVLDRSEMAEQAVLCAWLALRNRD